MSHLVNTLEISKNEDLEMLLTLSPDTAEQGSVDVEIRFYHVLSRTKKVFS